ncbi:hypothetical protein ACIQU7_23490 [Streptomyces albidoflavus]
MPGITTPQRARKSRKPSGLPNPPMILIAGPEKVGKSRIAAEGTSSTLIGTTYWIEIGGSEGTADYYGRLPGARYEIVEHDGSYQDILDAVRWAVAQPPADGKRNMIVLDNVSALWDMLSDEQALYARWRAEKKAHENRRRGPDPNLPVTVDPDLWNRAKDRWGEILWMLRRHTGPTVLLARQEVVTAFENDKPTRDKTRKIKAEKNLPAAVDAIVEIHALGEAYLTGVRTLHWEVTPGQTEQFENFTIDTLLRRLGFQEAAAVRQVTESRPEAYLAERRTMEQRPPAQQPKQQARQREHPLPLTGEQAVELIRKALTDENDPEAALHGIREEWGIRLLKQIPTETKRGKMSADALITGSLGYLKERRPAVAAAEERANKVVPSGAAEPTIPSAKSAPEEPHLEDSTATEDAPPPPDPEASEPPLGESPEETSAAEEPQDTPARPLKGRQDRKTRIAFDAFDAEADIQARLRMLTKSEHLGPITAEGAPTLLALRNYLLAQRPALIAQLEEEGHAELAAEYAAAPVPDTQIKRRFAAYFESTATGR